MRVVDAKVEEPVAVEEIVEMTEEDAPVEEATV